MKWLGKHTVFDDLMIGGVLLTPPDPATYAYELTLPNDDGTSGQVLQTDGNGLLTWVTHTGSGGTVTSITPAADSGSGTAITTSGTLTFTGGTNVTTAVSGTTVTINSTDTTYSAATSSTLGLLKIEDDTEQTVAAESVSATSNRTYGIQFNSSDQAVINVPWTDTNTTYTAGDGLDLSTTTFSTDIKANSGITIDSTELSMDLGASSITGTLAVGDGGTGATTLADNSILTGTGSSAITAESSLTYTSETLTIGDNNAGEIIVQRFVGTSGGASSGGDFQIIAGHTTNGNTAGGDLILNGGQSNGNGAAGEIVFKLSAAGGSGSGLHATVEILKIAPATKSVDLDSGYTFRGTNIGPISDTFIPIMPSEFVVSDRHTTYGYMPDGGASMKVSDDRGLYFAQKIIPNGYTATACVVKGLDADGDARCRCYLSDLDGTAVSAVSADTAISSGAYTMSFSPTIVGNGEKICTVIFDPGDVVDVIYGGKITIAKT